MAELYRPGKRGQIQRVLLPLFHGLSDALAFRHLQWWSQTQPQSPKWLGRRHWGKPGVPVHASDTQSCRCHTGAAGKTCPRKAPVAFWRGGDQKVYLLLELKGERFGRTILTRGERSKGLLQPCHPPPSCCFRVPALCFPLVSKKEEKKSVYAKQKILVTPPLPITR